MYGSFSKATSRTHIKKSRSLTSRHNELQKFVAEKEGNQWKTRIVSITFFDPENEFEEADYQISSSEISSDLEAINNVSDTTMDVDERVRQIEARAMEIELEYLQKFEQEIQQRKERYEREKAATFKALIDRGDKAFEEENYQSAINAL